MKLRKKLDDLFAKNNSGATRVVLFSKFYEELLRGYLEQKGYKVFPRKPKIYWNEIPIPKREISKNHKKLIEELKRKRNSGIYCVPDGLLEYKGKYIVWEAKNWVQELFYSPFSDSIWKFPWLLAKRVRYKDKSLPISGFLISWWENEPGLDDTLSELRQIVYPLTVDVIFTKNVLYECITNKYDWYIDLINEKWKNINEFFKILLGILE